MKKSDSFCPLLSLQRLLGKKWTLPLFFELGNSPCSFNYLKKRTNNEINPSLLSQTLKDLERFEVISKVTNDKVYYKLTKRGQELVEVLKSLKDWGEKYGLAKEDCRCKSCMTCCLFEKELIKLE